MCLSVKQADFQGTSIFMNLTVHPTLGPIMVMGYENTAVNQYHGPNAMVLHLPGMPMTDKNFLPGLGCGRIFGNLHDAVWPQPVTRGGMLRTFGAIAKSAVQVFEHGIYTVVLAPDARDIPAALSRVAANKRPEISKEICEFYANRYPGWPIALCCFDNKDARKADPLLVWYRPMTDKALIAPGLDCHTGGLPDLRAEVGVDHSVYFASDSMRGGHDVTYSHNPLMADLGHFLPRRVVGLKFNGRMKNGDFVMTRRHLEEGTANLQNIHRWGPDEVLQLVS